MNEYKISYIIGDGIGLELTEATLEVLKSIQNKFGIKLKLIEAEAVSIKSPQNKELIKVLCLLR